MCLYKITKSFDPYYSDDKTEGYKIFWYDGHSLTSPYRGGQYYLGRWHHDEKDVLLCSSEKQSYTPGTGYQPENNFDRHYRSGYHCYKNLKDAKLEFDKYRKLDLDGVRIGFTVSYILIKVKLKNIIVIGYEEYDGIFKKKLDIIVAKDMYIYSDIIAHNDKKKKKFIFF
jgi:hypothetical protein